MAENDSDAILVEGMKNRSAGEMVRVGGLARKMSFFQMAPKLFLSDQTHSNRCEYELYEVWFNKIDHIHTYVAAKVIMFFPGCSTVVGGPARKMSFFQMAQKLFLSDQTHSNRCEYELYEVWFNKIDHIHTYGAAKVMMFFSWVFYSRIFGG